MAERKATFVEVRIHKAGQARADRSNLELTSALGMPLPEFAIEAWDAGDGQDLDRQQGRSFSFHPGLMVGDAAVLSAHLGPYGEPGDVVDTTSNELVLEHDGEMANRNLVRACAFMTSAERGVLMIEHARAGSLRAKVERRLRDLANAKELGVTFTFTTLVRGQQWLDAKAELEALTILRPQTTGDLADGLRLEEARLELKILPAKGIRGWERLWLALRRGTIDPNDFLKVVQKGDDFGEVGHHDEVHVTVGDGRQSKTFVLGEERTPQLREIIPTTDPTGIPTDEELVDWGSEAAQDFANEDLAQ